MAKKMRNGLTQKQRKTLVRRVAEAIDIYEIRPNRPMRANWKNYPVPVVDTETRQTKGGGIDEAQLGLASVAPNARAGGAGSTSTVCKYCGTPDGHTGQCPVVSLGGAS